MFLINSGVAIGGQSGAVHRGPKAMGAPGR